MRVGVVARYVGLILLLNAFFMYAAAGVALFNEPGTSFFPLLLSAFITNIIGIFPIIFVPPNAQPTTKEMYFVVAFSWIGSCLFGMLPYMLYGGEFSIANAWFEAVSGYTTTGATVLTDIEALPKAILFWRSATHFIGGVGVVLFALLVLPSMRMSKMKLSKVEMSALAQEDFNFKSQQIIRVILSVYLSLTVLLVTSLLIAGMGFFDAICHSFSAVATGGFSTKNASIAAFNSGWIELIFAIFTVISGLHFGMIYSSVTGKSFSLFRSSVVRFYLISLAVGALLISVNLLLTEQPTSVGEALRVSGFHVVSLATTTGFTTANITAWPSFSILILIFFMMQCACAGSTSGGIKVNRILIMFKAIGAHIRKQQHPNAVIPVRVDGVKVEDDTVHSVLLFIILYMLILFITAILLAVIGIDMKSCFSLAISSLGNVGVGFSVYDAAGNLGALPMLAKLLLSVVMLMGRLEIFGLLLLFYMRSWR